MCNSKNQKGKKYQENNFKTTKNPTPAKQRQITKLKPKSLNRQFTEVILKPNKYMERC